jgi:hypothetical protein
MRAGHIQSWGEMQEQLGNPEIENTPIFCTEHQKKGAILFIKEGNKSLRSAC